MAKKLLQWTGIAVNRRTALRGAGATVFGSLMAVSVGQAPRAFAAPCSAPYGGGACYSANCSGSTCRNANGISCRTISGYCGSGSCWSSGGATCCDCYCTDSPRQFYCYCYG